ncbi:MAG: rhodanese-like domain-containing protein [Actinomycetota bacterium]
MTATGLPPRLATIVAAFAEAAPSERADLLLRYARTFPSLPASWAGRSVEPVPECTVPLSVAVELDADGKVRLFLDAPEDAPTTRAFGSILFHGLDGEAPEAVLAVPGEFVFALGLRGVVSPQRQQTISGLLHRIQRQVSRAVSGNGQGGAMDLEVFVTPGLGDNTFLVISGDEAVLVDPQRDAWRFLAVAEKRGVHVGAVLETHVHNDYVSGAHEVRAATGADIVAPAKGGYAFPHTPAEEGVEVRVGDLVLRAWDTPGHTYEHVSWAAVDGSGGDPVAVFSGGSLLVGSAGRTDLLGPDHVDPLTRLQWETVQRYRALPASVRLLPTHGAGSFCVSTIPSAERTSTIGEERTHNVALTASDEPSFARAQLAGLMEYPRYYAFMAPLNRKGPQVFRSTPSLAKLDLAGFDAAVARGAVVVDARDRVAFAEAHVPGSLNVEVNEGFGTYVGWMTPFDGEVVLILGDTDEPEEAVAQLIRVGYDRIAGALDGGMATWSGAGRSPRANPAGTTTQLTARRAPGEPTAILDVRQPGEWSSEGIIPGSTRIFVGDLPPHVASLPREREFWIFCTNGHRASIAASLLDAAGVPVRLIAKSGVLGLMDHLEPFSAPDAPVA